MYRRWPGRCRIIRSQLIRAVSSFILPVFRDPWRPAHPALQGLLRLIQNETRKKFAGNTALAKCEAVAKYRYMYSRVTGFVK